MKNKIQRLQDLKSHYEKLSVTNDIQINELWTVKDIIAHLNNWMEHDLNALDCLLLGNEPDWTDNIDLINELGNEKRKTKTYFETLHEFKELSEKLIRKYRNLPSNMWNMPVWKNQELTPKKFLEDDIKHWSEHLSEIETRTR